jgi:S-adenosylmethionine hydrolase
MIITLTTDFGTRDTFVVELKAVILSINPSVTIVDITHEIEPYNILEAAIKLGSATRYFPSGTIHIGVVDPGVGSSRRPLIIKTDRAFYVGPDNGIFSLAVKGQEVQGIYEIIHDKSIGPTFHGRDLFAPVAARLSLGEEAGILGRKVEDFLKLPVPEPVIDKNRIRGEVIIIDRFGNAITNIRLEDLFRKEGSKVGATYRLFSVNVRGHKLKVFQHYKEAERHKAGALINSSGYLEIFQYMGRAVEELGLKRGDTVEVNIEE